MQNKTKAISIIWSASLTLTFFWVLNIFKETNSQVKVFLNFYPPTGPLLGLFLVSILFFLSLLLILPKKWKDQKRAFWVLIISTIIFFLMTFPPIFEIFV